MPPPDANPVTTRLPATAPVVVVGGGVVERDPQGRYRAKAAVADYLHGLAARFGGVEFFAGVLPWSGTRFVSPLDPARVRVRPLGYTTVRGLRRKALAYAADLVALGRAAGGAFGVIEYQPAGGGLFATAVLGLTARRYVAYFGADPERRWTTPTGRERGPSAVKRLYFRLSGALVERVAARVVVRDGAQFERLRARRGAAAVLSVPVTGLPQPNGPPRPRCTGPEVRLLCVGKLARAKGVLDLLAALAELHGAPALPAGQRLRLTFVGGPDPDPADGLSVAELQDEARRLGLPADALEFAGYVDDMDALAAFYEQADVFVLPSHAEGFPRVLDEAALFGLPIVATALPGIAPRMPDGDVALLVPPRAPAALAAALRRIVADPALRARLQAGLARYLAARGSGDAASQHAAVLAAVPPRHGG